MAAMTGSHTRLIIAVGLITGIALLALIVPQIRPTSASFGSPAPILATTIAVYPTQTAQSVVATSIPAEALPTATIISSSRPLKPQTATSIPATATALPPTNSPIPVPISTMGELRLTVLSTRYELAGWPTEGCGKINPQRLVRRFDIQIAITNDTSQDLQAANWGAAAYTGKKNVKLCYFEGKGTLPPLISRQTVNLVLVAFVEDRTVEVDTLLVGTTTGKVAKLCFFNGLAKVCSS